MNAVVDDEVEFLQPRSLAFIRINVKSRACEFYGFLARPELTLDPQSSRR